MTVLGIPYKSDQKQKKHRMIMMMVLKHSTVCVILDIRLEVQINQNINEIQMLSSVNTQFIGAVIS